jgi:hypothetical protein
MNIVEKEANDFIKDFYDNRVKINNLENLKDKLITKLYNFNRDKDKLDFLKTLRQDSLTQKEEHLARCQKPGCDFPIARDYGLFVIDQEIDTINEYYSYEPKTKDKFTAAEESALHSKLNYIIDKLDKLGLGQGIIYEEIESLKNHFNLGKRNWFQLLKGKVIDIATEKVVERVILEEIWETLLSDGFKDIYKYYIP